MKIRATIHSRIARTEVLKRIHARLRPTVELAAISGERIDLLAFPPRSGYVASSRDVYAALEKLGRPPEHLVCVGYGFTQEARDYAHREGGLVFSLEASFGWTDESWLSVHQTRAT